MSSNYVLLETVALSQHRLGMEAVRTFLEDMAPMISIEWVDPAAHQAGSASLLAAGQKRLSLVDCVSFFLMRQLGIKTVFTFDKHFKDQGFSCIP